MAEYWVVHDSEGRCRTWYNAAHWKEPVDSGYNCAMEDQRQFGSGYRVSLYQGSKPVKGIEYPQLSDAVQYSDDDPFDGD